MPFLIHPSVYTRLDHKTNNHVLATSGMWIVVPGYLIYTLGTEILDGLVPSSAGNSALKRE